jgi:hypothetical protein
MTLSKLPVFFHKVKKPCVPSCFLAELSQLQSAPLVGQIEVDESYFGARRVRGKRGCGALGKTIVFGLLKV